MLAQAHSDRPAAGAPRKPAARRLRTAARAEGRRVPERVCVGCGASGVQSELLRCVLSEAEGLMIDVRGVAGRGAWLHARPQCIERAARGGFARSFRQAVSVSAEQVYALIRIAAERRLAGLVQAARSGRHLLFGRDMVRSALQLPRESGRGGPDAAHEHTVARSSVQLVILAEDAGSLGREDFVQRLAAEGKLQIWGSKEQHGQALGRGEVAILALTEIGLAAQVARTLALLRLSPLPVGSPNGQAPAQSARLSEDR